MLLFRRGKRFNRSHYHHTNSEKDLEKYLAFFIRKPAAPTPFLFLFRFSYHDRLSSSTIRTSIINMMSSSPSSCICMNDVHPSSIYNIQQRSTMNNNINKIIYFFVLVQLQHILNMCSLSSSMIHMYDRSNIIIITIIIILIHAYSNYVCDSDRWITFFIYFIFIFRLCSHAPAPTILFRCRFRWLFSLSCHHHQWQHDNIILILVTV